MSYVKVPKITDITSCAKSIISKIGPIQQLMTDHNVLYNEHPYMSEAVQVYGGFLRWIAESLSDGKIPTVNDFLATRADIDVQMRRYYGCQKALASWFQDVIKLGCVIEYAGIVYGGSDLLQVEIDPKTDTIQSGNYIIYIPHKQLKGCAESIKDAYLKVDLIFDCIESVTDFSANALRYPCKDVRYLLIAIDDIAYRRLSRISFIVTVKSVYRALKLLRRGYNFPKIALWQMYYIAISDDLCRKPQVSGKRAVRQRDLAQYAFTNDMSTPTLDHSMIIRTTKHPATKITKEFLLEQPDFRKFIDRANMIYKLQTPLYPFTRSDPVVELKHTELQHTELQHTEEVRIVEKDTIVYNICDLCHLADKSLNKLKYTVCVALKIPSGTKYICSGRGYARYGFTSASVHAVYAYPNVDITKIIQGAAGKYDKKPTDRELNNGRHASGTHPLQIRDKCVPSFTYSLNKTLYPKKKAKMTESNISINTRCYIYAYIDIDTAWANGDASDFLFANEISCIKTLVK